MERFDRAVGIIVSAAVVTAATLYSLGAQYRTDNVAESHTLFHWGAGVAGGAGALLVVVFIFWPAYEWLVNYRTRWRAKLPGKPALRIPFAGRWHRRQSGGSLEIIQAEYGREDRGVLVDVTEVVRGKVKGGRLKMTADHAALGIPDPIVNVPKELIVTYTSGRVTDKVVRFTEGFHVDLP